MSHTLKKDAKTILGFAKRRILSCTRSAASFPKGSQHHDNIWVYEKEFDRLNHLKSVR